MAAKLKETFDFIKEDTKFNVGVEHGAVLYKIR
jgi:hypothetical protein